MLAEGTEGPLVTIVVLLCVLVLDEPVIFLVDRIVSQVHVLILLVNLLSVGLRGEPGESLLENVDSEGLVPRHEHVDAQVELVPVDEQRVRDVLRNDARFVHVHIVDIIDNVDASALARVGWLDDPNVLLALVLLQLLVVVVKVAELVG